MNCPISSLPGLLVLALLLFLPLSLSAAQPLPISTSDLPDPSYLFAYFIGNGEDGLHLAWSRDSLAWEALGEGKSYLQPKVGESKLMRDPCILQGPDGIFHMVWTTSWEGKTIGYASSRDLIQWSAQKAVPVMAHEPDTQNCWAPEVIWDAKARHFLIFWSATILGRFPETHLSGSRPNRNHRIYSTNTSDFVSFSTARLHYDGGFNVIDATLVSNDGAWLMFLKNETEKPKPEKNVRLVRAGSSDGPFSPPSSPITGDYWAEGPTAIKVGEFWQVYFDKYRERRYGMVRSRDLETWEDWSDRVSFPDGARHGTVLTVPAKIVSALLGPDNSL
ncbi:MAG: glycosyl hydrolase [Acidobacteria bacterium]|nr:MAG: glycosyl hydrolase [Acidobacteriota bacterium]